MKRSSYIIVGALGLGLALWSGFMLLIGGPIIAVPASDSIVVEIVAIVVGITLAATGLYRGREAAELDRVELGKPILRDHNVHGPEIDFCCPSCNKVYRASPLLAGRPFMCRECDGKFEVPMQTSIRALPATAA